MTKDLKLWRVEFFIKDQNLYNAVTHLEGLHVYNLTYKTVTNGKANGAGTRERSANQQEWIIKNIKGEFAVKDFLDKWEAAGYPRGSFYAAIARAIDHKVLKKVRAGTYKPVGKA